MSEISNIIGIELPKHITSQLEVRSRKNSVEKNRTNEDLIFAANKTAWIRVVSSVDISKEDIAYFRSYVESEDLPAPWVVSNYQSYGANIDDITDPSFLAKKFLLFGGTSKYDSVNKRYNLRSGLNGAYAPLGENEINKYGYRPMPGITSAVIDTAGRMGSIRYATISFKVWDKMQLDIIDALYFKLGYSMFIEWGQTYFYKSDDIQLEMGSPTLYSSEDFSINPFERKWSKEALNLAIARASEQTQGNYDGMLGTCTNFNFSMNQEGGYDCTIKVIGLGFLADSIKINQHGALVDVLKLEIKRAVDYRNKIEEEKAKIEEAKNQQANQQEEPDFDEKNLLASLLYEYKVKISREYTDYSSVEKYYSDNNAKYIKDNKISFENNSEYSLPVQDIKNYLNANSNLVNYPSSYNQTFSKLDYYQKNYLLPTKVPPSNAIIQYFEPQIQFFGRISSFLEKAVSVASNAIVSNEALKKYRDYKNQNKDPNTLTNSAIIGNLGIIIDPKTKYTGVLNLDYISSKISRVYDGFETVEGDFKIQQDENGVYFAEVFYGKKFLRADGKTDNKYFYFRIKLSDYKMTDGESSLSEIEKSELRNSGILSADRSYIRILAESIKNKSFNSGNLKLSNFYGDRRKAEINFSFTRNSNYETRVKALKEVEVEETLINETRKVKKLQLTEIIIPYKNVTIQTNDSSVLLQLIAEDESVNIDSYSQAENLLKSQDINSGSLNQDLSPDISVDAVQKEELSKYRSGLEIALRAIQLHSLNNVFDSHNDGILDDVLKVDLLKPELSGSNSGIKNSMAGVIFTSNGVFKNVFEEIINDNDGDRWDIKNHIDGASGTNKYSNDYVSPSFPQKDRMIINAKYGFSNHLMSMTDSKEIPNNLLPVNYKKLLNAFVIPYIIDNSYIGGGENSVQINHPVYINLGTLIAIINNMCTLYETETEKIGPNDVITPLVYIDFNPETNFCLSNPQQISVNPLQFLVPCYASKEQFEELFEKKIIQSIRSDKNFNLDIFDPKKHDKLSGDIYKDSPFKTVGTDTKDTYKGKIMNVLISIDYLLQTIRTFSTNDGNGSVYLRSFIERIVFDMNKSLGSFNILRLAYNDKSNVLYIIDDQLVPSSKDTQPSQTSEFTMPLYGRNSIARSLEMRTEISSKLGSMIAIASNPTSELQNAISQDVTSFGFINQNYKDRYIKYKQDATIDKRTDEEIKEEKEKKAAAAAAILEQDKTSVIKFNAAIKGFFGSGENRRISIDDINFATNYYIDRMSIVKSKSKATRASVLIPLSLNFTTDGVGGINMYNSFSVSEDLLPYTYSARSAVNFGYEKDYIKKVGFCIIGLSHRLENNSWTTDIRSQMVYVKNNSDYVESIKETYNPGKFEGLIDTQQTLLGAANIRDININQSWEKQSYDLIASFEGYEDTAYGDEGNYRVGYGSDYVVYADLSIKKVAQNTKITADDAKRTLIYRIKNDFSKTIINQIGTNNWEKLRDNEKAALVSFAYNVGSLTNPIVKSIRNGDSPNAISRCISDGPKTGKISGYIPELEKRRKTEAAYYLRRS